MTTHSFLAFYRGIKNESVKEYRIEGKGVAKKPLYYSDIKKMIIHSYTKKLNKDPLVVYWFRAFLFLGYCMFIRGDEI